MKKSIGVMQGRFTNKGGFYPQQFPWDSWRDEFFKAKNENVDHIEWMFNAEKFEQNPIYADIDSVREIEAKTGVSVVSICANYFMINSIWNKDRLDVMSKLFESAGALEVRNIIIPLFDESDLHSDDELIRLIDDLSEIMGDIDVNLLFETNYEADKLSRVFEGLKDSRFGICYDLGNAAGLGKDVISEINSLRPYIKEIHIKDKPVNGSSVMVGMGVVPFDKVLNDAELDIPFVLETFFAEDAVKDTKDNLDKVRSYIK